MRRLIGGSLIVAVVGAVLFAGELSVDAERARFAYLGGFAFGISVAVGGLFLLVALNAAHVVWVVPVRRLVEAVAGTLPLYLVLFVPIALGLRFLYPWARPAAVQAPYLEHQLANARAWMNPAFVVGRAYGYMLVWVAGSLALGRASVLQDTTGRDDLTDRQRTMSAALIPVVGFTATFAAFDWFMSLIPGWYSDMYGVYLLAGGFLAALAITAVLTWAAQRGGILPERVGASHVSAVGRLLLMAVIFWAYIGVATLILIWTADLPHEVPFLAQRVRGSWALVSALLVVGHFALPFLVLLPREWKRSAGALALVGAWLVLMHACDVYWLVVAATNEPPRLLDAGAFLAVGGLALAFGAWCFSRSAPYPLRDPNLPRALRYESE